MELIKKFDNELFKRSDYKVNDGYEMKITKMDEIITIDFEPTINPLFQPKINYSNGKFIINGPPFPFFPEDTDKMVNYIYLAKQTIDEVKKFLEESHQI